MINDIKDRPLLSLNQKQSLCIVTMILSVFFLRYKLECLPSGVSIEKFCISNKVPYNPFVKWYKDTRKKIIHVQVLGAPDTNWVVPLGPNVNAFEDELKHFVGQDKEVVG